MLIFPFLHLTWRESVIGVLPTEKIYMQVEHNWVSYSKPGYRGYGAGQAMGENLGCVKWRMFDKDISGKRFRVLHSESNDIDTKIFQVEEITVDPRTNEIVQQNEQRTTPHGFIRSTCIFHDDHIENRRIDEDGRTVTKNLYPTGGMEEVQRRFEPLSTGEKTFQIVDGITGRFHLVKVELAGRFGGNWGADRYSGNAYRFTCEGKEQTVFLTKYGETVKVVLGPEYSIALMGQTKSHRYGESADLLLPISN